MAIGLDFGKYRLIAELGHGGMADVFLALVCGPTGSGFMKLAVVKRLRPNLVEDPEFVTMLIDEARITARLNHPNVIQTLEVGTVGEEYFLAMEYLEGQPLHRIQKRCARGGAPLEQHLEYLVIFDALAGLHHAHELSDYDGTSLGIVHRDITPQNILVTYDGQAKVLDFGIAKAAGRASETRHGIVKGKVRYMAPEQAMGQHIDRRADIFSIGILLWEAATGKRFWRDEDDLSIVQSLVGGDYDPSPKSVVSDVPDAIDVICRRALAHNADDRYATAAELQAELELAVGRELGEARRRLGPKVAELFAKERAQLRSIVEQAGRESVSAVSLEVMAAESSATALDADSVDSFAPVTRRSSTRPIRFRGAGAPATPVVAMSVASDLVATLTPPPHTPEHTEVSLLGFIPRTRRFGAGWLSGAAAMLASIVVAIVVLATVGIPTYANPVAGGVTARSPRVSAAGGLGVEWASTSARVSRISTPTPAATAPAPPAPPPAPAPLAHHPTAPRTQRSAPPHSAAAPIPSNASAVDSSAPTIPTVARPREIQQPASSTRRTRAADTGDPWD